VLIVVGGPQYRVGSHRQFVLLARALAAAGTPAMRFDYRGMGDSEGEFRGFEAIGDDIAAAIGAFRAHVAGLEEVVLWGLCDAASAIMFYAYRDSTVVGIVLLNPWVRTDASEAKTYLKHYYRARVTNLTFWRKLLSAKLNVRSSVRSFISLAWTALLSSNSTGDVAGLPLPERLAQVLEAFPGPILFVISGNDLTAHEFKDAATTSNRWQCLLREPRVFRRDMADADHTFSRREWSLGIEEWTIQWVLGIEGGP
jgi:exosortase A-associated hydrolase 1